MPSETTNNPSEVAARQLLTRTAASAIEVFGPRFVAAYVLGSLAHGGFAPLVSDLDFGLILSSPLEIQDADNVAQLGKLTSLEGEPLSTRLSVFWGSVESLNNREGGRFPPIDILDLVQHGVLLCGKDIRIRIVAPTKKEIVISSARFAIEKFNNQEFLEQLNNPPGLIESGVLKLTKTILFPIRFLYTARIGEIGQNERAVAHFISSESNVLAQLAEVALLWRTSPPKIGDTAAISLISSGLIPLYRCFVAEYRTLLSNFNEHALANSYNEWSHRLCEIE